jgi:hypothetical protein
MAHKARLGGFLIASGFLAYLVLGIAQWYTDAQVGLGTILGSILLFVGARMILAERGQKGLATLVLVASVGAYLIGRALAKWDTATLDDLRNYVLLATAQSLLLTGAGSLAIWSRASALTRALVVLALLGNLAYGGILYYGLDQLVQGTWSFDQFRDIAGPLTVLDDLLLFAALAYAFTTPSAAATPVPAGPSTPAPAALGGVAAPAPPAVADPTAAAPAGTVARNLLCPRCKAPVAVPAGQSPRCGACGFGA